ncbi:MAG TPA: Rpn family recombination-promoting nuclease/putative transposase [Thermoanaerobaculia bacterium]|nr:Rpn family recombination-promoting nuclease/putative transposase [Thermoanaerobaculia bacterium]
MPQKHDRSYRLLFSHPRMVEDLLRGFLPLARPPGTLERRSEIYVSDRLEQREQDLVWRIRGPKGEPVLYLVLEFQSRKDPEMSLRVSVYVGMLRQDLRKSREIPRGKKLPLVLAVVVYNGEAEWSELSQGEYLLIDVRRGPLPAGEDNLVVLLCELERSRTSEEVAVPVEKLARLLADPEDADLRRAFLAFLKYSLLPARFPNAPVPALHDLEEVRPMLRETVIGWTREWKKEGLEEGKKAGRREGEIRLLVRQLELKFGPLSPRDRKRIDATDSDRLLEWGERILTARSLGEVFGD